MEKDKNKIVLRILILLVIFLVVSIGYVFVLEPTLSGYAIRSQAQGMEYVIISLVNATSPPNCQSVPFTVGNTSVTLVALECLEQEVSLVG